MHDIETRIREYEWIEFGKYSRELEEQDREEEIPEECEGCNNHQCFKCGYGFGG